MKSSIAYAFLLSATLFACGPSVSNGGDNTGGDDAGGTGPDAYQGGPCTPTGAEADPTTCSDGIDNDCDGRFDCSDPDCSGVGSCPVCGQVNTSAGSGIVLPDGVVQYDTSGNVITCNTDADCTDPSAPNCIENECHASYTSTLDVVGFGNNQTFDNANIVKSVCVSIEHSWLRDMEIRLIAPGGQVVRLQKFLGRTGGEVFLGEANDCDEGAPSPGTGEMYCWKPAATNPPMLDYANNGGSMLSANNCNGYTSSELPPGDYSAADPWTQFDGSPLNGTWKFVVTDLWPIDNGFLFNWTINFDPNAVGDCSGPIVN